MIKQLEIMKVGNWAIVINGVGSHHNDNNPGDANKMFQGFVKGLMDAGHSINRATFTFGGEEYGNLFPYSYIVDGKTYYTNYTRICKFYISELIGYEFTFLFEGNTEITDQYEMFDLRGNTPDFRTVL